MAVYTKVSAADVAAFIAPFNIGTYRSHDGITQGVENTNYHLHTDTGRYILTIFEKRIDPDSLPFVFAYADHLVRSGINAPAVLGGGTLAGKSAAVIAFLNGSSIADADLTPAHCAEAGALLARMHVAAKTFVGKRDNPVGPMQWRALYQDIKDKPHHDALAEYLRDALSAYQAQDLPAGAVHADLFPNNVFFGDAGNISGVFDFYFACTAPFVYDLGMTLNAWCLDESGRARPGCLEAFAAAYEDIRPLNDDERSAFPALRRAAALRIFLTRLYDWHFTPDDAQVVKHDPDEYIAKLNADIQWP